MRTEKRAMYKACHQCGNDHLVGDPCIPGGNKPATAINLVEVTYKDPSFLGRVLGRKPVAQKIEKVKGKTNRETNPEHELLYTGGNKMGEVMTKTVGDKTFIALVCHNLRGDGWERTPEVVTECLDSIDTDETIACVLMGSGMVGQLMGADIPKILGGVHKSKKNVALYSKDTPNFVVIPVPAMGDN